MNERIKELALQADRYTSDLLDDRTRIRDFTPIDIDEVFNTKFAELIIKECVKVVDETMTGNQEMNIGLVMASAAIVAHFGVEE